jgi:acetyl esterase/lipase
MGFSAGGHLACFAQDVDFRILCYPVIDFRQNESVCGAILEDSDDQPQRDAMLEHLTGILIFLTYISIKGNSDIC